MAAAPARLRVRRRAKEVERELNPFTIEEEVSHLTRIGSEPCPRGGARRKRRGVSAFEMLSSRESGRCAGGGGGFSSADRAYASGKHLPAEGPWCVEDMDSEAYVSQFSSDGSLLVAGFRGSRIRIYDVDKGWKVHKNISCRSMRWTVSDIALSPDQRYLAYSSLSPIVHIVNVQSAGRESDANVNEIHEGLEFCDDDEYSFGIFSVKFSKDGREVVVGNNDSSIYVYDLGANKVSVRTRAHMYAGRLSQGDCTLVLLVWGSASLAFVELRAFVGQAPSKEYTVKCENLDRGCDAGREQGPFDMERSRKAQRMCRAGPAARPRRRLGKNKSQATLGERRRRQVLPRESKRAGKDKEEANADVNTVTFADESGNILYSGSDDNLCKVWDRRILVRDKPAGVLTGHLDGITCIDSRGDGRYLISNCKDQTIKLWDVRKMSATVKGRPPRLYDWDYRWMAFPTNARYCKHPNDQSLATYRGHSVLRTLIRCYFSPIHSTGQRYIYTGSSDDTVYIYDVVTGAIVKKLSWHRSIIRDCTWHPYRPTLVSSSWDGYVARWEASGDKGDPSMLSFDEQRTSPYHQTYGLSFAM